MFGLQLVNTKKELTDADAFKKYQNEYPNDKATDFATFSAWLKHDARARSKYTLGYNVEPITSLEKYKENIAKKNAENQVNAASTAVDATAQTLSGKDEKNKINSITGTVMGAVESVRNSFGVRRKSIPANIAATATNAQLTNNIADDDLQKQQFSFATKQEPNNIDRKLLSSLVDAMERGVLPDVQRLLEQLNIRVCSVDIREFSADMAQQNKPMPLLYFAIITGRTDIVNALLKHDTMLEISDRQKEKEMESAVLESSIELAQKLYDDSPENLEVAKILALLRVRKVWQDSTNGLHISKLMSMIKQIHTHIESARGRDKVLFIGATGAGKSVLLNYLTGTKYKPSTESKRVKATPESKEIFHVNRANTAVSDTLYPQAVSQDGLPFVYCDLPGMFDNRGIEEKICAANGLHLLGKLPGKIKGMAIVTEESVLRAQRGELFINTVKALANIITLDPTALNNVIFIITQTNPSQKFTAQEIIKDYIDDPCRNYAEKVKKSNSAEDALSLAILQWMRDHPDRIFIPDIFDVGQSGKEIENALKKLKAEEGVQFSFNSYEEEARSFENALLKIVQWYLSRNDECYKSLPIRIKREMESRNNINARIQEIELFIRDKEAQMTEAFNQYKANEQRIENSKQEQLIKSTTIENNNEAIAKLEAEVRELEDEIKILDSEDLEIEHIMTKDILYEIEKLNPWRAMISKVLGNNLLAIPKEARLNYPSEFPLSKIEYKIDCDGIVNRIFQKPVFMETSNKLSIQLDDRLPNSEMYEESFKADKGIKKIQITFYARKKNIYKLKIAEIDSKMKQKK